MSNETYKLNSEHFGAPVDGEYVSLDAAFEAAVRQIEDNTAAPTSIEHDGRVVMSTEAIRQRWTTLPETELNRIVYGHLAP